MYSRSVLDGCDFMTTIWHRSEEEELGKSNDIGPCAHSCLAQMFSKCETDISGNNMALKCRGTFNNTKFLSGEQCIISFQLTFSFIYPVQIEFATISGDIT